MKKVLILFAFISCGVLSSYGQETEREKYLRTQNSDTLNGWTIGGLMSVNGSQTSLTNWVAGGQNSFAVNTLFNIHADLKKGNSTWENSLDFGYGLLKQGEQLFDDNRKWIKTDDRLDITSKYGQKASDNWYYAGLLNFRTQTTAGYDYAVDSTTEISGFLAPAYLLGALGMDYKPNNKFSLFIAPITSKFTFVNDDTLSARGAFGVDPGSKFRSEFGGYLRIKYKTGFGPKDKDDKQHMFFTSKLDLFSNYIENPERIDVNWENLLEIEVWKMLSLTLSTHLIYDDDIDIQQVNDEGEVIGEGPRLQFKQVLSAGISWKFGQE